MSVLPSTIIAEDTTSPVRHAPLLVSVDSGAAQPQPHPHECDRHDPHPHYTAPPPQPALPEHGGARDGALPSAQEAATPTLPVVALTEPSSPQTLPRVEQSYQQLPVTYAPWGMMPPPMPQTAGGTRVHQPYPTPGALPSITSAAGAAQGTPVISLGLQVPLSPAKRVLTLYAPLLLALTMAMGLLLLSFFTPICTAHLNFTRGVTDIQGRAAYTECIQGSLGKHLSTYALFSPCTVFKQHACDIITDDQVSGWMQSVTNGMQAPLPDLLFHSGIDQAHVRSCSYIHLPTVTTRLAPQPRGVVAPRAIRRRALGDGDGLAQPAPPLYRRRGPSDVGSRLRDVTASLPTIHSRAPPALGVSGPSDGLGHNDPRHVFPAARAPPGSHASHVRIVLNSSAPQCAEAVFTLRCDGDAHTAPMLNLTAIHNVDVSAYLLDVDRANTSKVMSAVDLITSANPKDVVHGYKPGMTTCAEYLEECRADKDGYYVVIAPASPLYSCGQGSIRPPGDGHWKGHPPAVAGVVVCDLTFYELTANTTGALRFTARAQFVMNMVLYPAGARFTGSTTRVPVSLTLSSILLMFTNAFVLLATVLTAVALGMMPRQRAKLRQLSAALEADASLAMGILYRAQSAAAVAMPWTAAPTAAVLGTPGASGAGTGHTADTADGTFVVSSISPPTGPPQPHIQVPQQPSAVHTSPSARPAVASPMLLVPPYYESGAMVVPPPMPSVVGSALSPYSEGYYLQPELGPSSAAAPQNSAADGVATDVGTPNAGLSTAAPPPEMEAQHEGICRSTARGGASGTASSDTSPLAQEESAASGSGGTQEAPASSNTTLLLDWHSRQRGGTEGVVHSDADGDSDSAQELASLHEAGSSLFTRPSRGGGGEADNGERAMHEGIRQRSASSPPGSSGVGDLAVPMLVPGEPDASLTIGYHSVLLTGDGHAADAIPPPVLVLMQHWQPLTTVSAATDWMFMRSRHVVSQDMLEESVVSTSNAEEREAPSRWWRLRGLRDRVLRRSRASTAGASVPSNWPDSDSEDELSSDNGMPGVGYGPTESSPGARTIQLFLRRARKSYTRLRRQQVTASAALLFYAKAAVIAALLFGIVATGLQLWNVAARNRERLQLRGGDELTDDYVLDASHLALMSLSLAILLIAVLLTFSVERKRVW
ncbi:hypothetical protein LSCM1_01484 [Leishmania martiniquensis]|uniref:Uncharacterized protein n=1 Tax=Leishmania martiniquensis TaxID=1580590 RepID=A0A836H6P2_9TRYP|nr:hypothetical protein LSCM1_01484 [Leishmania martiniquensis]